MKECTKCGEIKQISEFYQKKRGKNKKPEIYRHCKSCHLKICKEWRDRDGNGAKTAKKYYNNNSEKYYERDLFIKYGLTLSQYLEMDQEQNNCCKICGEKAKDKRLCVDHDHSSGQVRNLLCDKCNQLSWFGK